MQSSPDRNKFILTCLACVLLPLALYAPSLNAPFIFDDYDNIVHNADVQYPGQMAEKMRRVMAGEHLVFERIYWVRPVTFFSFAFTYRISGLNPYGHRLFGLLFHAAAVLMLFLFTRKIFRLMDPGSGDALPIVLSLAFAVHPMNTDAVTFLSNRSDVIATFFYLAGLYLFLRWAEITNGHESAGAGIKMWMAALSLMSFFAALNTKEIAATFPLIVLLLDWIIVCKFDAKRLSARWRYHAASWGILACAVAFRAWYSHGVGYLFPLTFGWTKLNYFYTELWVVSKYLRMLIFPSGQSMDHWITPIQSFFAPKAMLSLLFLLAVSAITLISFRKSRYFPLMLFAALWFFITLTPTSSFLPINDAMVERRVYLPMWGFLVWAICLIGSAVNWDLGRAPGRKTMALAAIYVLILCGLTLRRNALYADPLLLWKESAALYPDNYRAHFNAGNLLYGRDGNFTEAQEYYLRALAVNDDLFEPHMNLGVMLAREKKFAEAERHLLRAREIRNDHAETAFNLAVLYKDWGKDGESVKFCEEALRINPNHERAKLALEWLKKNHR